MLLCCLPPSRRHQLTALLNLLLQQELDPGYFNYAVVTGTLQRLTYVESDKKEDDKWLRFELKVPTPGSDTFTRYMSGVEWIRPAANTHSVSSRPGLLLQYWYWYWYLLLTGSAAGE